MPENPQTNASIRGVLERIVFFNEDTHFCIAELRTEEGKAPVMILGVLPNVQCGESLCLSGKWSRHPLHGEQFKVQHFRSELPATVYGIRKYLGSGLVPGIGQTYANKIVDHFGVDTFQIISEESARLRDIPGIGKNRAQAIKKAWEEQKAVREVMVFLQTYGVSSARCIRLVKQYGNEAREILRNEPYRIAREIDGIGFKTADKIAINLGYANDSPPRLDAGILFALDQLEGEGHSAYPEEDFLRYTSELLQADGEKLTERIDTLDKSRALCRLPVSPPKLQLPGSCRAEVTIAGSLDRLRSHAGDLPPIHVERAITWAQEQAGAPFGDGQIQAIRQALQHKVSVITGGAGTGKTTILRALSQILKAKKVKVLMAAPTGRASQRLADSTGSFAQTIHRLLKFDPGRGGFTVNRDHPLKTGFLVVDEASMLDTQLASSLFQSVPLTAHLVLVGDTSQLPSVGPGNVLNNLIQSGLPAVTKLETIYRQKKESLIVSVADAINCGRVEMPSKVSSLEAIDPGLDFHFVEAVSPEDCTEKILALCAHILPRRLGIDPIRESQVLSPMHKGVSGVENLNRELQRALNPAAASTGSASGAVFRPGDKIIQLRNDYDKGLFNGDLGTVVETDAAAGTLTADFDGDRHEFDQAARLNLSLAYAISIHKSQGSEYPAVIIPLLKQHYMMLQRNLIYTAVTRGKQKVFIVGDPAAYAMAVRNNETRARHTGLLEKIGKGDKRNF